MTPDSCDSPNLNLDAISIASPCTADWNAMTGDETVRFCGQCQLNVYNLSGMNRNDAEQLVSSSEGRLCVRFFRRPDGTLLTQDCPVGIEALHRQRINRSFRHLKNIAAAVTLITAVGAFTTLQAAETGGRSIDRSEMGDRVTPVTQPPMMGAPVPPKEAVQGNMVEPAKMGEIEAVPPPTPMHQGRMANPPKKNPDKPVKPCPKPPKKNTTQQPPRENMLMGKVRAMPQQ